MIREKIFRLHRHKSSISVGTDASGQKLDFFFCNFQAIQVPKGWDKLSVSLISPESGKAVHKSGKAPVKNGSCQWTETFSDSIWISDGGSSKEIEEHLFKFLVAAGSSKSSILGETTLNLAAFQSSESPILVSLPLKKCNYGTILQVEVKCLTPKANLRDEKWKGMQAIRDENADHDNIEDQSEVSDCTTAKSTESFSSNNLSSSSRPQELGSRETSFSASVSRYSFDSIDDSVGRQSFSSQSELNGGNNVFRRQDSMESNDSTSYCSYSTHGSVKSVRSLQGPFAKDNQWKSQREEFRKLSHATAPSLQQKSSSSSTLKEADDATVQELEAEARMWEQNARKLSVDMDRVRKELSDQNLNVANLNMELAASQLACHKLSQEIEHLKFLLEESRLKLNVDQNSELQEIARSNVEKELEDEIRFQKEENEDLSLQLKKTQEANIELISVLQEMEETIDKQRLEIESLSANKLDYVYTDAKDGSRHENCSEVDVNDQVSANELKSSHDCDLDISISKISEAHIHQSLRENNCIELELLNMQQSPRTLQGEVLVLKSTLQEKIIEIEIEQYLKSQVLKDFVVECNNRLAEKEEKIMNLEAVLSRAISDDNSKKSELFSCVNLDKENRQLKENIQELETDCNELIEENLKLLFELKELKMDVSECSNVSLGDSTSEASKLELCIRQPVKERKKIKICQEEIANFEVESENLDLLSQRFTVKNCNRVLELRKCHKNVEKQVAESQGSNRESNSSNVSELGIIRNVDGSVPALLQQLHCFLVSIKKECDIGLPQMNGPKNAIGNVGALECINFSTQRLSAVLDKIVQPLHTLLTEYENDTRGIKENLRRDVQKNDFEYQDRRMCVGVEESTPCSHIEPGKSSDDEPNFNFQSRSKENESVILKPYSDSLKKEKEIKALRYHNIHVSDNEIDESRLTEPENSQTELVKHLTDLQEENMYLSQRVSGLEAQLRYLSDKKESSLLELQHSESKVMNLEDKIKRLEEVIELQKLNMKQKLLDMQKQWSEAQEECTALSKINIRLQTTIESLIEEYNLLQKFNGELREQKTKLQDHCLVLEAEARKYQDSHCDCEENIGNLEVKYSLLKEEICARENSLDEKLDDFNAQKKEDENKFLLEKQLLNQIQTEKGEKAAIHVGMERGYLGAGAEKCYGCDCRNELDSTLNEVQGNLEISERDNKVVLGANQKKLLIMFENIMNGELKRKSIIDKLESKIKLSELERLQLAEENSLLRIQLQKVPELQNEVLSLRVSLKDMNYQTHLLKASFKSLSEDYEELKYEKGTIVEKNSSMQKAVLEAEDCRRRKNALEEKILRLEGDLIAIDALCVQDAERKHELNQIKIANSQLLMKVQYLEDIREDLQSKVQFLEQELKQTRFGEESHYNSTLEFCRHHFHPFNESTTQQSELSKNDTLCMDQRKLSIHLCQPRENLKILDYQEPVHLQFQDTNEQDNYLRKSQVPIMDSKSRIQFLENELAKALEANDAYKSQLESNSAVASKKSETTETIDTAKAEHRISLLEAELQEIRERYLQKSLKYAEVEDQRGQLVMKLKALNI